MSNLELIESLKFVDGTLESRMNMAYGIADSPETISSLIGIACLDEDPISCKASWVLEVLARDHLHLILPHLNQLISNLGKITLDSSVRPLSKICESLVLGYFKEKETHVVNSISDIQLEQMTTACFDWLISEQKVAVKAYAMSCLYHLGIRFLWVHPELKLILEQNYQQGSPAYQARARQVLKGLSG